MKYLISSVTIGACMLLFSAGDVFAHSPPVPTGQQGTGGTGVASCGGSQPSPSGQANNTTNSPFPGGANDVVNKTGSVSKYAGAGTQGNYGAGTTMTTNTAANSQYDVACLQQVP
jgi:hypothetical protein